MFATSCSKRSVSVVTVGRIVPLTAVAYVALLETATDVSVVQGLLEVEFEVTSWRSDNQAAWASLNGRGGVKE